MKRGILALLTAVFLAGSGTAQAVDLDLITDGGFDLLADANAPGVGTTHGQRMRYGMRMFEGKPRSYTQPPLR